MACAKRRAEANSSGRSLRVLRLVSMASTIESGKADSLSNTAIFCSCPSSRNWKLSFFSAAIGAPCSSVTVTNTFTSLTSTLKVVSDSWATETRHRTSRRPAVATGFIWKVGAIPCILLAPLGGLPATEALFLAGKIQIADRIRGECSRTGWSLRCTPLGMGALGGGNLIRKGFAIRPHRAIFEMLLLPDWHRTLEGINEPAAGVKRCCAVGRGHYNQDAGFADFETSQAVNDVDIAN